MATNPYENKGKKDVRTAYVDPKTGKMTIVGGSDGDATPYGQKRADEFISKGYAAITDPTLIDQLYQGALDSSKYTTTEEWQKAFSERAGSVGGPSQAEIDAAKARLAQAAEWENYSKPVSTGSATPSGTGTASGGGDSETYSHYDTTSGYNGFDAKALADAWLAKQKSGVEQSANSQINTIMQNLAEILSNLETEKAGVNSQNKKQLETIHNNEFATSETQKELMNQSGWNPNNSGLAVGELGKIKVGADKQMADANAALVEALNDIARRGTLANTRAGNDKTAVENWKSSRLAGAEADALMYADQIGYQRYRDALQDAWNEKMFNYNKGIDDRNFNYQTGRDSVSDAWNQQQFDYNKSINDRNYNYQASRDQVLDDQWMKQFTAQEQQRLIENAMQNRQISVSEGNLALQKAASGANKNVGDLYSKMMSSGDPGKWLIEHAKEMTDRDFSSLYELYTKNNAAGTGNSEDYKTYLDIGLKMKDATKEDLYEKYAGVKEPYKTAKYSDKEIMDWVKGLDLDWEEKVKLINALGIKEP